MVVVVASFLFRIIIVIKEIRVLADCSMFYLNFCIFYSVHLVYDRNSSGAFLTINRLLSSTLIV